MDLKTWPCLRLLLLLLSPWWWFTLEASGLRVAPLLVMILLKLFPGATVGILTWADRGCGVRG